jgi:hypothetical protein
VKKKSEGQATLTLDDLDRFLSVQPLEVGLVGYLRAAAVLSIFDPFEL